ncbi:unnamed protein product [Fusarium langsethiae]|nr:unnamed protein product [Fusarium langsethiae]
MTAHHNNNEWNEMCKAGTDRHFQRGQGRYQKFTGDPDVMPNPCMGPVKVGPFYAIEILPGDAGTRGGPVTDELARVLDRRGNPIHGWFAGGNASISRLDTEGAGTTIGPAMTEGFVAATHIQSAANIAKHHEWPGAGQELGRT